MYFLYVDESGDPGVSTYSSKHYILSGMIVLADDWLNVLHRLKVFRHKIKQTYKLSIRAEIHAAELIRINKNEEYRKIHKTQRINILRDFSNQIPILFNTAKLINICLNKSDFEDTTDFFTLAWSRIIQQYDTFLKTNGNSKGIIIADDTNSTLLRKLLRKKRVYNPLGYNLAGDNFAPTDNILEDVFMRESQHSYFIQTVDTVAHLLYRKEYPKGSLKKYGIENLFDKLKPILITDTSDGIIRK